MRSLFLFVTGATPGGTKGRLSTTECTYLPTYGLSEATPEPMSAFIQPDGSINPIFRSYVVANNEGQLLTRAETLSQRKKKN